MRLRYTSAAAKQLRGIKNPWRDRIAETLDDLASDPFPLGHRRLRGYRSIYRVYADGGYRIVYKASGIRVKVLRIEKRGPDTYRGFNPKKENG